MNIEGLKTFPRIDGLPDLECEQREVLQSEEIRKVICFCLGPEGTNIVQAARNWLRRMLVLDSEVVLCKTPEECLEQARQVNESGVLAIYWACAVYARESQFFFGNPDVLPFSFQEVMFLDEMQLATIPQAITRIVNGCLPGYWRVASHPSPQHLLAGLHNQIILVDSNAAAAKYCAEGLSEACITTESARKIYGLETLHVFGSPPMVFFGGITPSGIELVRSVFQKQELVSLQAHC